MKLQGHLLRNIALINAMAHQSQHDARGLGGATHRSRAGSKQAGNCRDAMTEADQERQLLSRLRASFASDTRGFTAESDGRLGVLILNNGHYRGVWQWIDGTYAFTPGGYGNATYAARSS